jgi:hypothetical protein
MGTFSSTCFQDFPASLESSIVATAPISGYEPSIFHWISYELPFCTTSLAFGLKMAIPLSGRSAVEKREQKDKKSETITSKTTISLFINYPLFCVIYFLKKRPLPEMKSSDSGPTIPFFNLQKYLKYFWTPDYLNEFMTR